MSSHCRRASAISVDLTRIGSVAALCCAMGAVLVLATGCSHYISDPYEPKMETLDSTRSIPVYVEVQSEYGDQREVELEEEHFILEPPYDEWFSEGLVGEFRRAGFDVYSDRDPDIPHVTVEPVDFYGDYYEEFYLVYSRQTWGLIAAFDVQIDVPGSDRTFERRFVATDQHSSGFGTRESTVEDKLRGTLSEVYEEIVTETHRLLDTGTR